MKKILSGLLVFLLVVQLTQVNVVAATTEEIDVEVESELDEREIVDTEAPELNSITFNLKTPKVGDVLEIYIGAKDDISGINKVKVFMSIGNEYFTEIYEYDDVLEKYKDSINLTEDMKYKKVRIIDISMEDNAGNYSGIYNLSNMDKVRLIGDKNGVIDDCAPKLNGLTISKRIIKAGESVDIIADVEEDISGIDNVYIQYLVDGGQLDVVDLEYDEEIKKYKATLQSTEEETYSNYSIIDFGVSDKAGNRFSQEYKGADIDRYKIYISDNEGKIDNDSPQINTINISSNTAKVGDKVKISVDAIDATTGINSIKYIYKIDDKFSGCELLYNDNSKMYEAEIQIKRSMNGKKVEPVSLEITDKAKNYTIKYKDELKELLMNVVYDENIYTPIEVIFNPSVTAKVGDEVKVSVKISEDILGVQKNDINIEANIGYTDDYSSRYYTSLSYNEALELYEGSFIVNKEDAYKNVEVKSLIVKRENGRYCYSIGEDFECEYLNILDIREDNEGPILNSCSLVERKLRKGEIAILNINATDDVSGIKSINVSYENRDGSKKYNYNRNLNSGERGDIKVWLYANNSSYNDKYFITEIELIDIAGNKSVYTKENMDFSELTFEVGNYLEEKKVTVKFNVVYDDIFIIEGKTSRGNVKVIRYYYNGSEVIKVAETITDDEGYFKINLNLGYDRKECQLEILDIETNEVLGYEVLELNKSVDVDRNGVIDILDVSKIAFNYGMELGTEEYKQCDLDFKIYKTDINYDNHIDLFDLTLVARCI